MLMEQAKLNNLPETQSINDWTCVDRNTDALVIHGPIKDYSPLLELPKLRHLYVHQSNEQQLNLICRLIQLEKLGIGWMRSIKSLAPIANLTNLEVLALEGNLKEVDLKPLGQLKKLRVLSLAALMSTAVNGNAVYCESFAPLANLDNLEYLELFAVRSRDRDICPITQLKSLKALKIGNDYSQEDYARLAVALPNTEGLFREPYYRITGNKYLHCKKCGGIDLVVLLGKKRGSIVCSACDHDAISNHITRFEQLKQAIATINQP